MTASNLIWMENVSPTSTVKFLGVLFDDHLLWLRLHTDFLFPSHLLYGSQIWRLTNQNKIQKLQSRDREKFCLKNFNIY